MIEGILEKTELLKIDPVLPSQDIERDVAWYLEKTGFKEHFSDKMYAVIYRENLVITSAMACRYAGRSFAWRFGDPHFR